MPFIFSHAPLEGVVRIESKSFMDERGYFAESYKLSDFKRFGIETVFKQDNHSFSRRGVVRGLHFQKSPNEQGKLVQVISGEVYDVAVDVRPYSKNFSQWYGEILSEENRTMLWIPSGFAHGFQAIRDSHVYYKVTREFSQKDDYGIRWDDPDIGISWPIGQFTISEKDSNLPFLKDLRE